MLLTALALLQPAALLPALTTTSPTCGDGNTASLPRLRPPAQQLRARCIRLSEDDAEASTDDVASSMLASFAARVEADSAAQAAISNAFASQMSADDDEIDELRQRHSLTKVKLEWLTDGESAMAVNDDFASRINETADPRLDERVNTVNKDLSARPKAAELSKEIWRDVKEAPADTAPVTLGLVAAAMVGVAAIDALTTIGAAML